MTPTPAPTTSDAEVLASGVPPVVEMLPLVRGIAHKVAGLVGGLVQAEELYGAGVTGLMIAREDHEEARNFRVYAAYKIQGAMLDDLREMDWAPTTVGRVKRLLERITRNLEIQWKRHIEGDEVADALGLRPANYEKLRSEWRRIPLWSLQTMPMLALGVIDENALSPEELYQTAEIDDAVVEAVNGLETTERRVISFYYFEDETMSEVAEHIGRKEPRTWQIHEKAIRRLRAELRDIAIEGVT